MALICRIVMNVEKSIVILTEDSRLWHEDFSTSIVRILRVLDRSIEHSIYRTVAIDIRILNEVAEGDDHCWLFVSTKFQSVLILSTLLSKKENEIIQKRSHFITYIRRLPSDTCT